MLKRLYRDKHFSLVVCSISLRGKWMYNIDSRPCSQDSIIANPSTHPDACLNDLNFDNSMFELKLAHQEEAKQQLQRENEINSAIRCLTTNFYLCFLYHVTLHQWNGCGGCLGLLKSSCPCYCHYFKFCKNSHLNEWNVSQFQEQGFRSGKVVGNQHRDCMIS